MPRLAKPLTKRVVDALDTSAGRDVIYWTAGTGR
jgi:hypothetical protein